MAGIDVVVYIVCFLASLLGPLCGIGGGVIIKPVVDSLGILPVATVSFLSSVSVLVMALATFVQNTVARSWLVDIPSLMPMAIGSAAGGCLGKVAFEKLASMLPDAEFIGGVQALVLIFLSCVVLIYTLRRQSVRSRDVSSGIARCAIGGAAGACWSFLGIGGGPFNLALLTFFCSMESRYAAQASLFIILLSQLSGVGYSVASGGVPPISPILMAGACLCAIGGSIVGRRLSMRFDSAKVDRLYLGALALIIVLSVWNVVRFLL